MRKLIREIVDPTTTYELEPVSASDLARALQLDAKFHQLEIGLVDGVVAAVAERRRVLRVLTVDRRGFGSPPGRARFSQGIMVFSLVPGFPPPRPNPAARGGAGPPLPQPGACFP